MANKNPFTEEGRKTLISEGVVFPISNNSVTEDNSLVTVWNNQPVVSSRDIAIRFEKRHDHVLRDIKKIQEGLPNFGEMFFETTEPDSLGRQQRIYLMNYNGFRTGHNRLFDWLVGCGYLYRRGREYRVYQQFLDQ